MTDDTSNPFKKLAKELAERAATAKGAGKGAEKRRPAPAARGSHPDPAASGFGSAPDESDDSALFLHSVSNIKPLAKADRKGGVALGEALAARAAGKQGAAPAARPDDRPAARPAARPDDRPAPKADARPAPHAGGADAADTAAFFAAVAGTASAQGTGRSAPHSSSVVQNAGSAHKLDAGAVTNPGAEAEEAALFFHAMNGVAPVNGKGRDVPAPLGGRSGPAAGPDPSRALRDLLEGRVEFSLQHTGEYLEGFVVGTDPLVMARLKAGQYSPEKHLDLHGMNATQAYDALTWFIKDAYQRGLRTVVVVTGRGKNSPDGVGVLRPLLSQWLSREPFKRVVLAFCTAMPHDGGPGAVYVLIRKYKKSRGKILWERVAEGPEG